MQAWASRPPWLDKSGLQELFKTKGGDLHIRTVARIQTLMVTDSSSDWVGVLCYMSRDVYAREYAVYLYSAVAVAYVAHW